MLSKAVTLIVSYLHNSPTFDGRNPDPEVRKDIFLRYPQNRQSEISNVLKIHGLLVTKYREFFFDLARLVGELWDLIISQALLCIQISS
jgi:hypothetical protein